MCGVTGTLHPPSSMTHAFYAESVNNNVYGRTIESFFLLNWKIKMWWMKVTQGLTTNVLVP